MAINLKTFAKDLTYQADTSVRQIFKDLKELAEIKQLAEKKVAYFRTLAVGIWLGIVLIIIVGFFAAFNNLALMLFFTEWMSVVFFIFLILIITAIFCSVKQSYYNKLKLRDERCELPKKILSMVNRDRTPKSNVKIMKKLRIFISPFGAAMAGLFRS